MWITTVVILSNADDMILMHNFNVFFTDSIIVGFYLRQPTCNQTLCATEVIVQTLTVYGLL
jgi:hypothetical protein